MINEHQEKGPKSQIETLAIPKPKPVSEPNAAYEQKGPNNIRLAKSAEDQALEAGMHNVGMDSFVLPAKEQQLKGFWVEKPGVFVGQYRQYKFHHDKKEGTVPSITI